MNNLGYRCNGGVGFSVAEPVAQILLVRADEIEVSDQRVNGLHESELTRLADVVSNISPFPIHIKITGDLPSHRGMGSATAIRLAVIESIFKLAGRPTDERSVVTTSGRGGTSGIGIASYFSGGLIFDAGVAIPGAKFAPSSAIESERPTPLVLSRLQMPEWRVGICIPNGIPPQTPEQERKFFNSVCPIDNSDVYETLYHVVYGVVASVQEHNFEMFCSAIRRIQQCKWKREEWMLYDSTVRDLEASIYNSGASAVGMSSLGPGLYFFADDLELVMSDLRLKHPEHTWIGTICHNSGRSVR